MSKDKVLSMLGMAKRAGCVQSGAFLCEKAIKSRVARLVILAEDSSPTSKKSITDACRFYRVQYIEYGNMEQLGQFTGSDYRAVVSVTDQNFAQAILQKYADAQERNGECEWKQK